MPNAWRMLAPTLCLFNGLGIHILFYTRLTGFHKNNFYQLAAAVFSIKKAAISGRLAIIQMRF